MFFKWEVINTKENIEGIKRRAGNCKSTIFPCDTTPKSIGNLWNSPSYTGHDLNTGSIFVLIDTEISKPLRVALLSHYSQYINVTSSASSMHRPDLFDGAIDNLPTHITYGISFVVNLRLIKRIITDFSFTFPPNSVSMELEEELHVFIHNLKEILTHFNITIPESKPVLCIKPRNGNNYFYYYLTEISTNMYLFSLNTNLIIAEQFARYSDRIMLSNPCKVFSDAYRSYSWGDDAILIEGVMHKSQLATIYNQRKDHKRHEWHEICAELSKIF